jgi:hypothetical protein
MRQKNLDLNQHLCWLVAFVFEWALAPTIEPAASMYVSADFDSRFNPVFVPPKPVRKSRRLVVAGFESQVVGIRHGAFGRIGACTQARLRHIEGP